MNEQELFWTGDFGAEYMERNGLNNIPKNIALWSRMLAKLSATPQNILELGCNIGINLHAIKTLFPNTQLHAVELNPKAIEKAKETIGDKVQFFQSSILEFTAPQKYDLAFISGVLIHIAPENLPKAYDVLYNSSTKYIFLKEYYSPFPVEVEYRGHSGKLFKRDFCGDMLDRFPDLRLVDYGFVYHRDPLFPMDDPNWFLLEKVK